MNHGQPESNPLGHITLVLSLGSIDHMAGGIGNLVDRVLRHGLVTDFAVVHIGPLHTGVFNLADVLIIIGVAAILWTFRESTSSERTTR